MICPRAGLSGETNNPAAETLSSAFPKEKPSGAAAKGRQAPEKLEKSRISGEKTLAFSDQIWYNALATLLVSRKENYCEG